MKPLSREKRMILELPDEEVSRLLRLASPRLRGEADASAKEDRKKEKSGFAQLNALVGLAESKEQIHRIAAFHALRRFSAAQGRKLRSVSYHMCFTGNPGTAKTTAARIFARILREEGVLTSDCFLEAGRADLISKYQGHTAIQVRSLFKKARGGLLFIDEAYSLIDGVEGGYGQEAVAALVAEMENHREDTVVILAGYPKEMENLFAYNPGLRSRVPFTVHFPDYSVDELIAITASIAKENGYRLRPDVPERLRPLYEEARRAKDFGNGRFVRNLVESAELARAAAVYDKRGQGMSLDDCFTLGADDFALPASMRGAEGARIGFA